MMTEVVEKGAKRPRTTSVPKKQKSAPVETVVTEPVTEEEVFSLVVTKSAKEKLKRLGCHTGGEVINELNSQIDKILIKAAARCLANGRKTVKVDDL